MLFFKVKLTILVVVVFWVVSPPEASTETKVCELDVALGVDEDVVGLDVPMDEAHGMNALHSARPFSNVKSGKIDIKVFF